MSSAAETHPDQLRDSRSPVVLLYAANTSASALPMRSVMFIEHATCAQASAPDPASSVGNHSSENGLNSIWISYVRSSVDGPEPNWSM